MEKDVQNGYVTTETHKGITTIEFFHPQSNALPRRILETWPMKFMLPVAIPIRRDCIACGR